MLIARVVGEMVATRKHPSHEGRNLLLVQPLELDGSNRGDAVIALDAIGAGVGDKVLLTTDGYAAMSSVGRMQSPIDMAVIGFIDRVDLAWRILRRQLPRRRGHAVSAAPSRHPRRSGRLLLRKAAWRSAKSPAPSSDSSSPTKALCSIQKRERSGDGWSMGIQSMMRPRNTICGVNANRCTMAMSSISNASSREKFFSVLPKIRTSSSAAPIPASITPQVSKYQRFCSET
jgi:ethanolamine utilization protein EutN